MNPRMIITLFCVLAYAGCVSVESSRAQLDSGNPEEVRKAEENIYQIVTYGQLKDPLCGSIVYDQSERMKFLEAINSDELLVRVLSTLDGNVDKAIKKAAIAKLDFTKPGIGFMVASEKKDICRGISVDDRRTLCKKCIDNMSETELRQIIYGDGKSYDNYLKGLALDRLVSLTDDVEVLYRLVSSNIFYDLHVYESRNKALLKLIANSDRITNNEAVGFLLSIGSKSAHSKIIDDNAINKIAETSIKLPASNRVGILLDEINMYKYRDGGFIPLRLGIAVASTGLDEANLEKLVGAVLGKIEQLKAECRSSFELSWDSNDSAMATELVNRLPKMSVATISNLLCRDATTWKQICNLVTEDVAYEILASGKAKSEDFELALVKQLPQRRLDMKVYNGARFDVTRKAVKDNMPPEIKREAAKAVEVAFAAVAEKAKVAAKETFELDGFYLGMTFEDLKIAFAHHFPDVDFQESVDGEGEDANHVLYVAGQKSPFCYADMDDARVWRINFGKSLLRKWYKYDAQTPIEWVSAYKQETKMDMRFKMIEKETTVYESDMSRSYDVWFYQESYQCKHVAKNYRLTYFGEEKDITVHGGIGGALIKEKAAKDFRFVRGDIGSLRATIERD